MRIMNKTFSKSTLSTLSENEDGPRRISRNLSSAETLSADVTASISTVTPEQIAAAEHKGWSKQDGIHLATQKASGLTSDEINVLKVKLAADAEDRRQFAKLVAVRETDANASDMIEGGGFGGRGDGQKIRQAMKTKRNLSYLKK